MIIDVDIHYITSDGPGLDGVSLTWSSSAPTKLSCLCLSLSNLLIIISEACHYLNRLPFGFSLNFFQKLESKRCLDNHVDSFESQKTIFFTYYNYISKKSQRPRKIMTDLGTQIKFLKNGLKNFINKNYSLSYRSVFVTKLSRRNACKIMNPLVMLLLLLLSGDVESNPGPIDVTLISQNCRGLKCKDKLKQILFRANNIYGGSKIIALQETHLESSYLKYSWPGNTAITPSSGAKGGIITLLSGDINILDQIDIDSEAQILFTEMIKNNDATPLIIVNLHSPCAHDQIKIDFFKKIRTQIDTLRQDHGQCELLIMGDFNTTFWPSERINTTRSKREVTVANCLVRMFEDLNIIDCWNKFDNTMTWRHSDRMSRLDRIQWSHGLGSDYRAIETKTDWSLTTSDHAAVIVRLQKISKAPKRSVITRIDTSFINNIKLRSEFVKELDMRMSQIEETNLDPHGRLEFLKMTIRSIAIEIATNYKKEMEAELKEIQSGIAFWQTTFENSQCSMYRDIAIENLDTLMTKRNKYLNERGKYLSERSKSKWYQEGERSTKYFLNLNKAKNNQNEMSDLIIDGNNVNDRAIINSHVEQFYKNLYEKGDQCLINSDKLDLFLRNLTRVPDELVDTVDSKLTTSEIFETLKSCSDSAPGPDGIPYSLIKLTWKHFGPMLIDSWYFAESSGRLSQSHESSYLRLLPKEGKDTRYLKNWRPITLSNCDFKLITKTLSWRVAKAVDNVISPNQAAYMKNRQISDNLNIMLYTTEQQIHTEGMIVSLDAEKAFDSIEHWYIKEVLKKIGLNKFVRVFDMIYMNQGVEIILNGNSTGKYTIRNGVKQGDALSCILFILGIEPLLENINNDNSIRSISCNDVTIPRALAYADDIACLINPNTESLQKIFDHYDDLTQLSGLRLNADKTEIICNKTTPLEYNIFYNNKEVVIQICDQMKVNGLALSYNIEQARKSNIDRMIEAVEGQLKSWSNRNLSLLGKIQIFKTFGLSQILYTLTNVEIKKSEEAILTGIIYKFIWNKNMDVAKAPDRIKRQTLLKKVKNLGFGMIDYKEVVKSIRLRNLIRLINSERGPLYDIIRINLNNSQICIRALRPIRANINMSIDQLRKIWSDCIRDPAYSNNVTLLCTITNEYIGNIVMPKFKKLKLVKNLRNDKLGDIICNNPQHPIIEKLDRNIRDYIQKCASLNIPGTYQSSQCSALPYKHKIISWPNISSRQIRNSRASEGDTTLPKMLTASNTDDLTGLGRNISKLTNSKLKSILLRCLHGDVYSRERMVRFGMMEDNRCPRCDEVETTQHMLCDCTYVKSIWFEIYKLTNIKADSLNEILGLHPFHDKVTLTIHAETLRRLLAIERPITDPRALVKSIISSLYILEKGVTKYQISRYLEFMDK